MDKYSNGPLPALMLKGGIVTNLAVLLHFCVVPPNF